MRVCWRCWRELREQAEQPRTIVLTPVDAALLRSALVLCAPVRHPPEYRDLCERVSTALANALASVREGEAGVPEESLAPPLPTKGHVVGGGAP